VPAGQQRPALQIHTPSAYPRQQQAPVIEAPAERSVASMVFARKKTVIAAAVLALCAGVGYLKITKPTYTASAALYIDQSGQTGVVIGQPLSNSGPQTGNYLATQCQIIASPEVLAMAMAQPGIADLKYFRGQDNPLQWLNKNISAEVDKRDDLITVTLDTEDPTEGPRIVNGVVQAYMAYEKKLHRRMTEVLLGILRDQQVADRDKINTVMAEMSTLRLKYSGADTDPAQNVNNPQSLMQGAFAQSLAQAKLDTITAKAQYDEAMEMEGYDSELKRLIELPPSQTDIAVSSSVEMDNLRQSIFRLGASLEDLQRQFGPNHPRVSSTRAQLNQLTVTYIRAAKFRYQSTLAHQQQ
jgi:succinoglycan biosynthesis transport protein ExoP